MSESDFNLEILTLTNRESIELGVINDANLENESTSLVQVSMRKTDVNKTIRRSPTDIVLVIDTSGSMSDSECTNYVEASLNLLEVVVHAVKTVIGM